MLLFWEEIHVAYIIVVHLVYCNINFENRFGPMDTPGEALA